VSNDNYRFPAVRMPFRLKDPHFLMTCFKITTANVNGVLIAAQAMMGAQRSAIQIIGSDMYARITDSAGSQTDVAISVPEINTLTTATLTTDGTAVVLRKNGSTSGSSLQGINATVQSNLDSLALGFGYWNFFPQQATQGAFFGWISGPGNPSSGELGVLESYLRTFGEVTAPPVTTGEDLLQAQYDAGNLGWWGRSAVQAEFTNDSAGLIPADSWTDLVGAWLHHANTSSPRFFQEPNAALRPALTTDGNGFHALHITDGHKIVNAGASTTAFHIFIMANITQYEGTLFSDMDVANHGFRGRYDGDDGKFYFAAGTGAATVEIEVLMPWRAIPEFRAPGLHLYEAYYDGTNMLLRIDNDDLLMATQVLGAAVVAGGADLWLARNPDGTGDNAGDYYEAAVLKNYAYTVLAERDAIGTSVAAAAGEVL
jgi:hypothetical protein